VCHRFGCDRTCVNTGSVATEPEMGIGTCVARRFGRDRTCVNTGSVGNRTRAYPGSVGGPNLCTSRFRRNRTRAYPGSVTPDVACIIRCTAPDVACIIMYYPVHLGAHIRCAATDVACIIRCTAPDLACIIRCISVPTSGALHHRVRTPHHRVPRDGYSSRFPCGRARRSRQGTSAPVDGRNKGWWEGGVGVSAARTGGRWQAGVAVAAADDAYLAPRGVHTVGRRGDDELSERQRGLCVRDAGATAVSTQPVARGRWASSSGQESVKAGARKTA
jgi:hypothetical protein